MSLERTCLNYSISSRRLYGVSKIRMLYDRQLPRLGLVEIRDPMMKTTRIACRRRFLHVERFCVYKDSVAYSEFFLLLPTATNNLQTYNLIIVFCCAMSGRHLRRRHPQCDAVDIVSRSSVHGRSDGGKRIVQCVQNMMFIYLVHSSWQMVGIGADLQQPVVQLYAFSFSFPFLCIFLI